MTIFDSLHLELLKISRGSYRFQTDRIGCYSVQRCLKSQSIPAYPMFAFVWTSVLVLNRNIVLVVTQMQVGLRLCHVK